MKGRVGALLVGIGALGLGCASTGEFFWVDTLPKPPVEAEDSCVIAAGDVIGVRVWSQDGLSVRTRVREDGKITIPFINDITAAGMAPPDLARRLQTRLKDFILNPVVTVSLEEVRPLQVSVVGEVTRPGVYQLEPGSGVLKALASAGGMTPFASEEKIFVLRSGHWADDPKRPARIRFSFKKLTRGLGRGATFALHAGDVVVVE